MVSLEDRIIALEYYALALTWAAEEAAPGAAKDIRAKAQAFVGQLDQPFPAAARHLQGLADSFAGGIGLPIND